MAEDSGEALRQSIRLAFQYLASSDDNILITKDMHQQHVDKMYQEAIAALNNLQEQGSAYLKSLSYQQLTSHLSLMTYAINKASRLRDGVLTGQPFKPLYGQKYQLDNIFRNRRQQKKHTSISFWQFLSHYFSGFLPTALTPSNFTSESLIKEPGFGSGEGLESSTQLFSLSHSANSTKISNGANISQGVVSRNQNNKENSESRTEITQKSAKKLKMISITLT